MSQPEVEQDNLGDSPQGLPKTVSKVTFGCLSGAIFFVILAAEITLNEILSRAVGVRPDRGFIAGLGILSLILSGVATDRILRLMGLSRSGKSIEIRGRTVAFHEGEVAGNEVVECRFSHSFINGLILMCLACCLLITLILVVIPQDRMEGVEYAYAIIGFLGLGAGYLFYERAWGKPQAWADASGITGYSVGSSLRRKFVSWSRVASCEIVTRYDTFGKPVIIRPILKGFDNETLMTLNLAYTKKEDQERLVKYIKAMLPKPKYNDWE